MYIITGQFFALSSILNTFLWFIPSAFGPYFHFHWLIFVGLFRSVRELNLRELSSAIISEGRLARWLGRREGEKERKEDGGWVSGADWLLQRSYWQQLARHPGGAGGVRWGRGDTHNPLCTRRRSHVQLRDEQSQLWHWGRGEAQHNKQPQQMLQISETHFSRWTEHLKHSRESTRVMVSQQGVRGNSRLAEQTNNNNKVQGQSQRVEAGSLSVCWASFSPPLHWSVQWSCCCCWTSAQQWIY